MRRAFLEEHNRSPPVPGWITLLAPLYEEGMERMYSDLARARYVKPEPVDEKAISSASLPQDLSES
eukprot:10672156-Lingulodinium_polyedra.AAC.1